VLYMGIMRQEYLAGQEYLSDQEYPAQNGRGTSHDR
jgi:hypothetical protein